MASFIRYVCKHFSKISAVLLPSCDGFSLNLGVPVNPKYWALLNVFEICLCISPNCDLWHSSIINTVFKSLYFSMMLAYLGLVQALAIFWIVVIISGFELSLICSINLSVWLVISTQPGSNLLNSSNVCLSKSFLSTKKNTWLIDGSKDKIWLVLNEVIVFPDPVVCHT